MVEGYTVLIGSPVKVRGGSDVLGNDSGLVKVLHRIACADSNSSHLKGNSVPRN
jgi:hypothetical protein